MPTYEELHVRITELERPAQSGKRHVHWVTDARVIGISRTHENRLEIFLDGPPLKPTSPVIKGAMEHSPWWHLESVAPAFEANRLLLPAVGYFDQVAAFLCTELLRNGADEDLDASFRMTEPIIELAIERLRLSDAAFLGLAGELLLLNSLCQRATHDQTAEVVLAWDGWRQSLRDFTWGNVGVEVKTTIRSTSSHRIHGTHQVERNDGDSGGQPETGLLLVSIGLGTADPHDNSFTVPTLVDRIIESLQTLGRGDVADVFLAHVREYGSGNGFGYDHETMSLDAAYMRAFEVNFVRAYDMTDANVAVLRRADVVAHQHVDAGSITYTVNLPAQVSGSLNPIMGLNQIAGAILGAARPS